MHKPKHPLLRLLLGASSNSNHQVSKENTGISRRDFLTTTSKATAFLGLSSLLPEFVYAGALPPRIAIVGAGIAGLNAAHYLKTKGIKSTIYEASGRTGGRIFTKKNGVVNGYTCEIGAEFIDSGHCEMLALVRKFGLSLKDGRKDPLNKGEAKETFFIGGQKHSLKEVLSEFNHYKSIIQSHFNILDDISNPQTVSLDNLSITAYLDKLHMSGWFRTLLETAYVSEYGMAADEQSSLNFISMIGAQDEERIKANKKEEGFNMYGESDEIFGIEGGNSMIIKKLSDYVDSQIRYEHELLAVRSKGKGFVLSFKNGKEVNADYVIMTLPFTMLRKVDMTGVNMRPEKRNAIEKLEYGNNAKLIMGFNKRTWRENGAAGYLFNEDIQNGWDSSHMQHNGQAPGSYTVFVGADKAAKMANEAGNKAGLVNHYLPIMNTIFPNSSAAYNGNAIVADWPNQPFVRGSYAAWKVGQWTTIKGKEIEPIGNMFFAGEHCSEDYQGFMEGGAVTGRIAASNILRKLNISLKREAECL